MEPIIEAMARNFFWTAMASVAIVAIVGGLIRNVLVTSAKQKTAREIAAYIAEGSMSAEDGREILRAGGTDAGAGCCRA